MLVLAAFPVFADHPGFERPGSDVLAALKSERGAPVAKGAVFVNGKYIPPPYIVERYGNVVRINSVQVTHPVVTWDEFLKTQDGYKVEMLPAEYETVTVEEKVPVETEEVVEVEVADSDVDELFEEEESSPANEKTKTRKVRRVVKKTEMRTVKVEKRVPKGPLRKIGRIDGPFVQNYKVKGLLRKVEREAESVEKRLRSGWFICFGCTYRKVEGDSKAAQQLLGNLWRVQQKSSTMDSFVSAAYNSGLGFLPRQVLVDMFRNRFDFIAIRRRVGGQ